jgi:hypothetical protein
MYSRDQFFLGSLKATRLRKMNTVLPVMPFEDFKRAPRVYRASGGWLITLMACGFLLAIGGLAGAWCSATATLNPPNARYWLVGICLTFGVLGVYTLLSTFRSKVLLFSDRIEIHELTRISSFSRQEIQGWRYLPASPPVFILIPREHGRKPIKVAQVFPLDSEFAEWIYGLPCLDSDDARKSRVEIRNSPHLGATPGERMGTLAKGRKFARVLLTIALLASLWGFAYPRPYPLAILALAGLPWIALAVVKGSHGLFRVDANRNDVHPNVAVAFLFPSLILLLRSTDFDIIHSMTIAWVSIAIGILLCLAATATDSNLRAKLSSLVAILACSLVYGYAITIQANVLLDHSQGVNYAVRVQDRRIVRGKTTTYQLQLAPWGPKGKSNDIRIPPVTYDYIRQGDIVNLVLRQGALGINWYYMLSWQQGPAE